jgi:hypothetical protein
MNVECERRDKPPAYFIVVAAGFIPADTPRRDTGSLGAGFMQEAVLKATNTGQVV